MLLDVDACAGVRLGPGTLYGAITRLEERGLIGPFDADDRRRPHRFEAGWDLLCACASRRSAGIGVTRRVASNP